MTKHTIPNLKKELIKRYYVLRIPYKKKKREEIHEEKAKSMSSHKKYSPKRWVLERTNSWHDKSESCLFDMKRK